MKKKKAKTCNIVMLARMKNHCFMAICFYAEIPPPTVATLLPVVCPMLPHSTRQLPSPAELAKTRHDEETTGKGRSDNLAESKLMVGVSKY